MTSLQKLLNITETRNAMYQIVVNDGTFDGGYNAVFTVFCEAPGNFETEDVENAVQAFAASLGGVQNAVLQSVSKVTAVETPL